MNKQPMNTETCYFIIHLFLVNIHLFKSGVEGSVIDPIFPLLLL